MSQLNKATFETTYVNTSGTFADNTTRLISEGDLRQFSDDIADSFPNISDDVLLSVTASHQIDSASRKIITPYTVGSVVSQTTISTASVLTANASPVTVVAAPGAGYFNMPVAFFVYLDYNSAAYATNTTFRFEINGVAVTSTNTTLLPGTADRYATMYPIDLDTTTNIGNSAIVFEVQTGNPTAGNSSIYVISIYKVVAVGAIA